MKDHIVICICKKQKQEQKTTRVKVVAGITKSACDEDNAVKPSQNQSQRPFPG